MKILLTIQDNFIAPRFDLTTEIIIAEVADNRLSGTPRTLILPRINAEDLCDLIVKEGISCVVCGGIKEGFHTFFTWKKISVIDSVVGQYAEAIDRCLAGTLLPGTVLPSAQSCGEAV